MVHRTPGLTCGLKVAPLKDAQLIAVSRLESVIWFSPKIFCVEVEFQIQLEPGDTSSSMLGFEVDVGVAGDRGQMIFVGANRIFTSRRASSLTWSSSLDFLLAEIHQVSRFRSILLRVPPPVAGYYHGFSPV